MLMPAKTKKIRSIFVFYWFLLAYIVAALIWWYIALSRQNEQMTAYKLADLHANDPAYTAKQQKIENERKRKTAQYIGEGLTFFLLILAGAIFVYRSVKKELNLSNQQQRFMVAVTHELKTPIAIAKLNLETLQKRKLEDTQRERLLENTLHEANRMNALCNNMLLSSQLDAGGYRFTLDDVDLSALLEECLNDFRQRYPKKSIVANIHPGLHIQGDQLLLQLAVNNLLDNAMKYTPKDTSVNLSLQPVNKGTELLVADQGAGIPDADKKNIFEKYRRLGNEATRQSKGTGLGLYLTQKIIRQHKGKIFVTDNEPSGARFVIQLQHTS